MGPLPLVVGDADLLVELERIQKPTPGGIRNVQRLVHLGNMYSVLRATGDC